MNLNQLMKIIPKEHWDKLITIHIPFDPSEERENEGKEFPLIEVDIEEYKNKNIYIILTPDTD